MKIQPAGKRRQGGFSMVELMLAVVLAGIIFAAMVPFFANALDRTSADQYRVDSTNLAQDRIEQVRLLDYSDITQTNLNSPPSPASSFGDGKFGTSYTIIGDVRPYTVNYAVDNSDPNAPQKHVTVTVTRTGDTFATTADAVIMNPAAGAVSVTSSATPSVLPTTNLSITVSFKNWTEVQTGSSKGVYYTRTNADGTGAVTSAHQWPTSASTPTVTFTGLTGGTGYVYTVSCYSTGGGLETTPPFHLLKSARLKFDTNPGGS